MGLLLVLYLLLSGSTFGQRSVHVVSALLFCFRRRVPEKMAAPKYSGSEAYTEYHHFNNAVLGVGLGVLFPLCRISMGCYTIHHSVVLNLI